jgi:hypothetical protein
MSIIFLSRDFLELEYGQRVGPPIVLEPPCLGVAIPCALIAS